ncbi:MAG: hypothetical protein JST22_10215 [Bacteroidetes bacterium]|nr:hypothetical protein [Bacteroidota bacterium]
MPFILIPIARSGGFRCRVEAQAWKEYTCVACGGTFRSLIAVMRSAEGKTAELAAERARAQMSSAIVKCVETRACPNCGCYQPDAEASLRIKKVEPTLFLPLLGIAGAIAASPAQVHPLIWLAGIAVMLGGVVRLLFLARYNVNRDPRGARVRAEGLVGQHQLEMVAPGADPESVAASMPYTDLSGWRPFSILLAAGMLLFIAADAGLWISGAPLNLDCTPVVAGPGDNVRIDFPARVSAVGGMWNARATVHVINAAELGLGSPELPATSEQYQWGETISGKGLTNKDEYLWADIAVPDTPELAGHALKVEATLDVVYPEMYSGNTLFKEVKRSVTYPTTIVLSAPGSGARQKVFSWISTIGGGVMIILGGIILLEEIGKMKRRAPQPRIYAADNDLL